jgi:hypothetical protein
MMDISSCPLSRVMRLDARELRPKPRVGRVPGRTLRGRQGPRDPKTWIQGVDPALGVGVVCSRVQIKHLAIFGHGLEAVRKPLGNDECSLVLGTEALGMPLEQRRRASTKVDGHIEDFAAQACNELHLSMRRTLEMHAAENAGVAGIRMVDLHDNPFAEQLTEIFPAEQSIEKASLVAHPLALDQRETRNGGFRAGEASHELGSVDVNQQSIV